MKHAKQERLQTNGFQRHRSNLTSILEQRHRVLSQFQSESFIKLVDKFNEQDQVQQIQCSYGAFAPFTKLMENCKKSAQELKNGRFIVTVYGLPKVGKSSLANFLLDGQLIDEKFNEVLDEQTDLCGCQEFPKCIGETVKIVDQVKYSIFPVNTNLPTASSLSITSGEANSIGARVNFSPLITGLEQLIELLSTDVSKNSNSKDDSVMEQLTKPLYLELWDKKIIMRKDLDTTLAYLLHPIDEKWIHDPILSSIEITQPIWGISDSGITLMECQASEELDARSLLSKFVSSQTTTLIWVFTPNMDLNPNNQLIKHIMNQIECGIHVVAVLNTPQKNYHNETDQPSEDIELSIRSFQALFPTSQVKLYVINLIHIEKQIFEMLQVEIMIHLIRKARSLITVFLNSFLELVRLKHLFVSRLVSMQMYKKTLDCKRYRYKPNMIHTRAISEQQLKDSHQALKTVLRAAEADLNHQKKMFDAFWIENIHKWYDEVKKNIQSFPIDPPYNQESEHGPPFWEYLKIGIRNHSSDFEKHLSNQIQRNFKISFSHLLISHITSVNKEFVKKLLLRSHSLQINLLNLKSDQASAVWNTESSFLFQVCERNIMELLNDALPLSIAMTSVVGSALVFSVFLAGAITATVLTAGIAAIATVGLSASGFVLYNVSKSRNQNESEFRFSILQRMRDNLLNVSGWHYNMLRESCLASLSDILSRIMEPLQVDFISIETIMRVDKLKINLNYEILCSYLWIREELTTIIQSLAEELDLQKEQTKVLSDRLKWQARTSASDYCWICSRKRQQCGHLCRDCDFIIGDICPFCSEQPTWIAQKIKLTHNDLVLEDIMKRIHLNQKAEAGIGQDPKQKQLVGQENSLHLFSDSTKNQVDQIISRFGSEITHFGSWFNTKYTFPNSNFGGDVTTPVIKEMQNSINCFVSQILINFSSVKGVTIYELKLNLLAAIHEELFSIIGDVFIEAHRKLWARSDSACFEICTRYVTSEPSFFRSFFLKEDECRSLLNSLEVSENTKRAIDCIHLLEDAQSPYNKFCIIRNTWKLIFTSQSKYLGADMLWEALQYILAKASYRWLPSDAEMIRGCLQPFLEERDLYILEVTVGISKSLEDIIEGIMQEEIKAEATTTF